MKVLNTVYILNYIKSNVKNYLDSGVHYALMLQIIEGNQLFKSVLVSLLIDNFKL